MIKTYSCGRGVHYVFIGGLVPKSFGFAYYSKQGLREIKIKELSWFNQIRYFFKKLSIQNSLYFGETTEATIGDIEGAV